LSCFSLSAALSSPTRRCDAGARNSVAVSPAARAATDRGQGTRGTWTEFFIRIQGVQHYLWRAVDPDDAVLDVLVHARRDANVPIHFFRRPLKGLPYVPRVIVTDKLTSYDIARRQLLPGVEHRQSRYLNNRAENSHRPTRRRERQMQRFKSSE
jgi:putative transposase